MYYSTLVHVLAFQGIEPANGQDTHVGGPVVERCENYARHLQHADDIIVHVFSSLFTYVVTE